MPPKIEEPVAPAKEQDAAADPAVEAVNQGGDPASPDAAAGDTADQQDSKDDQQADPKDQPKDEPPSGDVQPPVVEGLCKACFPFGPPEGYETFGCAHGSWAL